MDKVLAFFKTEMGRRGLAIGMGLLYLLVTGDKLPVDVPIPWLNVSFNELLVAGGISAAALSGSQTRK